MLETQVKIINQLGLHARPAARLVKLAGKFRSRITLKRGDASADAKSILSLLTLAAAKGIELELSVEGSDEEAAFSAVQTLFTDGFEEM